MEIILKVYKKFFVSDNNNVLFIDLMIGICNKIIYLIFIVSGYLCIFLNIIIYCVMIRDVLWLGVIFILI